MDFELSQDQKLLVDTVASWAKRESPPGRLRKLREDSLGYSRQTWKQMGDLGWLGVFFDENVGGLGGSFLDVALILEQLGTTLVPEPIIPSVVLVGTALRESGDARAQERWIPPLASGDVTYAFAYAESGQHEPNRCATKAEATALGYRLNGKKAFVLNGHGADELLVVARTSGDINDTQGLSLFMIPRETPGVSVQSLKLMDGHRGAHIELNNVEISGDRRLGEEGNAWDLIEKVLDHGAASACCEAVGLLRTSLDMTCDYLRTRVQFGVKIGTFQALQHRAVDMFIEVETARSMSILAAIRASDADAEERKAAISAAKAQIHSSGRYVTQQAIQLHGGIGITDEHDIGFYFKRMQALGALFGDEEFHVRRFSQSALFRSGSLAH